MNAFDKESIRRRRCFYAFPLWFKAAGFYIIVIISIRKRSQVLSNGAYRWDDWDNILQRFRILLNPMKANIACYQHHFGN